MECRPLDVTLISTKNLKDVNLFGKMDVYVFVSISGDKNKQRTPVHKGGGTSHRWGGHTVVLTVDEAAARAGRLALKFKIKAKRTLGGDKDVGRADVPVKESLEQGGASGGKPRAMLYAMRLPFGKTNDVLEFSCKFGEQFTVAAPPAAKKAGKPVMACPAGAVPPTLSSAAATNAQGGAVPSASRISTAGVPVSAERCARVRLPAAEIWVRSPAAGIPAAAQETWRRCRGLGLGLLGGLFGRLLIEDMISDC